MTDAERLASICAEENSNDRVPVVYFPATTNATIECARTGKPIPAVIVARSGNKGYVHCPVCSVERRERICHSVDLFSAGTG